MSGAAWITLEMVSVQGLSLLVFAVMARFLDPHDFGLASICFVLVHSCKNILFDSIATIIARKARGADDEYSTAFWMTMAVAAAAFAGLQAFSFAADKLFAAQGLGTVLRAMSAMLLVQGLARTQEVWMQRHFLYRSLAVRSICGALAGGAAGVACATQGFGVWSIVVQQIVTSLGGFALLWLTCPWRPGFVFSSRAAREILSFMGSMTGGNLAYAFNQNCDTILIGLFFGPSSVGIYSVAKRLRLALQLVAATPINGVALPSLAEAQHDPVRFARVLLTATSIVFAVCAPVFLGAAAISRDAIALVFGPQWVYAAPVFRWLALGGLFAIIVESNNTVFVIRNRPIWTLHIALLNVAATLLMFFALRTSRIDLIALPFVLPYLLVAPASVLLLRRATGLDLRLWLRAVLPPLIAAGALVLLIALIEPLLQSAPLPLRLAALVGGGAVVYAACFLLLSRGLVAEIGRFVRDRRRLALVPHG